MRFRLLRLFIFIIAPVVLVGAQGYSLAIGDSVDDSIPRLVISEIKIKNDTSSSPDKLNEFIELYNNSNDVVQLDDYRLDYYNMHNPTDQTPVTRILDSVALEPNQHYVLAKDTSQIAGSVSLAPITSFRDEGGLVRLIGPDTEIIEESIIYDEIAWLGFGTLPVGVYRTPASTKSLQRPTAQTDFPVAFEQALVEETPTPFTILFIEPTTDILPSGDAVCEDVVISELLPNPDGADSDNEFIEVHNTSGSSASLAGCSLQTSDSSKIFEFGDQDLLAGEYKAFYDDQTGLGLPNSAGGSVWLLGGATELQQVDYPSGLDDGLSWSLFGDEWASTYSPTPDATNELLSIKPCPAGQTRNTETNRCINIVPSTSLLKPCKAGQARNPQTNRCRSALAGSSGLKPCQPGQFRNIATNRCKKIGGSASSLKPCQPGQARNPATNRCRKVRGTNSATSLAKIKDIKSPIIPGGYSWMLAGVAGGGVLAYAGWEWRREIAGFFSSIIARLSS